MVKEERGTGLIPTFRFTPFGYFLSQIIHSLRSSVNVEDKLYDLLNDGLFKVQTYSPSLVIFGSKWIKKMRKESLARIFLYLKRSKSIGNVEDFALILHKYG
jgi:hypothetical protein